MTETETAVASEASSAPRDAPSVAPAIRSNVWFGGLALILLLAILVIAGWWLWREQQRTQSEAADWKAATDVLSDRIAALERARESDHDKVRDLLSRLDEATAGNRVLREELLGLGERANLLEDAIAGLARSQQSGELALRLDEVDFLLQLGEERARLFGDLNAAQTAFRLADEGLAALNEPAWAGLRQTLAQELAALRGAPPDPRPALGARIDALQQSVSRLPAAAGAPLESGEGDNRLAHLLGRLVRVHRLDAEHAVLTPLERAVRLQVLSLQLTLARSALERRDQGGWQAALSAASALVDSLFDRSAPLVIETSAQLAQLRDADFAVGVPELGATLRELRGLRAGRALVAPASPQAAEVGDSEPH